jgi:glycolate oxidase
MEAMWRLRCAIDSKQVANPGKMFPTGEAPALRRTGLHPLEKAGLLSRE